MPTIQANGPASRAEARAQARRATAIEVLIAVGFYAAILVMWELLARRFEPDLAVSKIAAAIWTFYPGDEFLGSLASTLRRIGIGYGIAAVVGIAVGAVLGLNRWLNEIFDPFWSLLRPIAPLAWVPIVIVWFGIGEQAAIFVIAFTVFFPIMLGTVQGIRDAAPIYREAARMLGAKPWNIVWEVSLPAALPSILAGLRVGLALAFAVIIAAELVIGFVLSSGLGYLLVKYTQFSFSLPILVAVVFAIGVLGLVSDQLLTRVMDWATPWRVGTRSKS